MLANLVCVAIHTHAHVHWLLATQHERFVGDRAPCAALSWSMQAEASWGRAGSRGT